MSEKTTRSFKSVGKTSTQNQEQQAAQVVTPTPIGIVTPLRLGNSSTGIFEMSTSLPDQIADNLRNLILTNKGERLGKFNFGANLKELTTEIVSQDNFDNEAMSRIKSAVTTWMPYVNLLDFSSQIDKNDRNGTGKIRLSVTYTVAGFQDLPREISIYLYII